MEINSQHVVIFYTWNARNQLSSMSGSVNASFSYDALGRRISKTINGTPYGENIQTLDLIIIFGTFLYSNSVEIPRSEGHASGNLF